MFTGFVRPIVHNILCTSIRYEPVTIAQYDIRGFVRRVAPKSGIRSRVINTKEFRAWKSICCFQV